MEPKVRDWLFKTRFHQEYGDRVTIKGQFPIGDYLKQLDPLYDHPKYKCDFLLLYQGAAETVKVILEYDGFEYHFRDRDKVHAGNFECYQDAADVERELILESYGYKLLRLNRFNVGQDPVETLSRRLYDLISPSKGKPAPDPSSLEQIEGDVTELGAGTSKHCEKCGEVKPRGEFFDPGLQKGKGGYGRICFRCKRKTSFDS